MQRPPSVQELFPPSQLFCLIQNKRVGPIGLLPSILVVDHIYVGIMRKEMKW
jgi:hypothetical protein